MVTEDYVGFETAKLLEEKGFDPDEYEVHYDPYNHQEYEITLQMAMKWLRDTFHLEIYPFHDAIQENNDWWYRIERHSKGYSLTEDESDVIYKTYEQAAEAAIKYCLENLI